jgi:hypothetical protein
VNFALSNTCLTSLIFIWLTPFPSLVSAPDTPGQSNGKSNLIVRGLPVVREIPENERSESGPRPLCSEALTS